MGARGALRGKTPWLLALLPVRWLLLREGQGAGGVEEAGAEGEKGLLLARKRSRGPAEGRGAKLHACCREAGRKKVRGKKQAAGAREVAARGDGKDPICKGEGSYL
jgi:hypothetical protein